MVETSNEFVEEVGRFCSDVKGVSYRQTCSYDCEQKSPVHCGVQSKKENFRVEKGRGGYTQ